MKSGKPYPSIISFHRIQSYSVSTQCLARLNRHLTITRVEGHGISKAKQRISRERRGRSRYKLVIRKRLDKRAVSAVISAVILTGAAIALGFAVLAWSQSRSSEYIKDYGEATDAEIARLKERLTVEYVFYNSSTRTIRIFLLNSGAINDTKIQSVYVRNSTWNWVTSSPPSLKSFNGASIPDQDLDMGEEGYVDVVLSPIALQAGRYYFVRIVTERGSIFESEFVA